jgi:wyosine [tRNA(Phe)-imidazoG37] synthetase (radical SAM superfamily)
MSDKGDSVESQDRKAIAYGPVPSRRLGRSLGINNIPPKTCTYSCVYCQLGRTTTMHVDRQQFYDPECILEQVREKVSRCRTVGESVDFLAFVPDGEPTLDVNLGKEIESMRHLGISVAVITNSSLTDREDVRTDLAQADLVSLKIDAITESAWRRVNRPHKSLKLSAVLGGIREFADNFKGRLLTETMLIDGVNDGDVELKGIANFLSEIRPSRSYIAIPTRPPAEKWVHAASEYKINLAYEIFSTSLSTDKVEYLIGYEGDAFAYTGRVDDDLLNITSVHPMRREALEQLLTKADSNWNIVEELVNQGKLVQIEYNGHSFYMRKLPGR